MDSLILQLCIWPLILVNVEAHCDLDGFDINSLSNARYWNLTITKQLQGWDCIVPRGHSADSITGCTIYFSVCKPLPKGFCSNHASSSTCLVVSTNDNKNHYFNIGNYNASPDHGFVPTEGEETGFVVVRHGSIVNPCASRSRKHYETVIKWRCGPDANWDPSSNDATIFASDVTYNHSSYSFGMLFYYSGACPPPPTGISTATLPPTGISTATLSPTGTSTATPPPAGTSTATPPPAGTSTATPPPAGTSTATPPPHTTNHGPSTSQTPDEGQKKPNIGLIVGLVVFASVCAILLLVLLLAAVLYKLCKSGGIHRKTPYNDL